MLSKVPVGAKCLSLVRIPRNLLTTPSLLVQSIPYMHAYTGMLTMYRIFVKFYLLRMFLFSALYLVESVSTQCKFQDKTMLLRLLVFKKRIL